MAITWIGCTGYYFTKGEIETIKAAAAYMGLRWQPLAAQPKPTRRLLDHINAFCDVAKGCEAWGVENRRSAAGGC